MSRTMHRRLVGLILISALVLVTMLFQSSTRWRFSTPSELRIDAPDGGLTTDVQLPSANSSTQLITDCSFDDVSARNIERRLHLIDRCPHSERQAGTGEMLKAYVRQTLVPSDFKYIFVDDKHKVLYCSVPKVASTNWKRVMLMLTGKVNVSRLEDLRSYDVHNDLQNNHLVQLSRLKPREIRVRLNTYFKFMFSRHPLERVVSAYENKFASRWHQYFKVRFGRSIIRRYRSNPSNESLTRGHDVTFHEFVRYLGDQTGEDNRSLDAHWQPYSDLCQPCRVHYDVIGKYETLGDDAAHVIDVIAKSTAPDDNELLASKIYFPAGQRHANRTSDVLSRFVGISANHFRRLSALYADDFRLFGYEYSLQKDGTLAGYQTAAAGSCRSDRRLSSEPSHHVTSRSPLLNVG